jgi:hypothetical protein
MENVDEIVTFHQFAERGLALPSCSFFRGLPYYYGLELHHLNPNSIYHISIFIYFCEAFLGVEPHWDLFRFLFRVKPQPPRKTFLLQGAPASNCISRPATNIYHTNSPPTFPGGKIIGSISRIMLPNSQQNQTDHL